MRKLMSLAVAAAVAAPLFIAPQFAAAQSSRSYGSGDICYAEKKKAEKKGVVTGAILGGILGAAVAGDDDRGKGALIGGSLGAVAGKEVGRKNMKCVDYPRRYSQRNNCRWVQEDYRGRTHDFEVCRGRDGVWRPSGRG